MDEKITNKMSGKKVREDFNLDAYQICYLVSDGATFHVYSIVEYFKTTPPGKAGILLIPHGISTVDLKSLVQGVNDKVFLSCVKLYFENYPDMQQIQPVIGDNIYGNVKNVAVEDGSMFIEDKKRYIDERTSISEIKADVPWFSEFSMSEQLYSQFIKLFNVYFLICSHMYSENKSFYQENLKNDMEKGQMIRSKFAGELPDRFFISRASQMTNVESLLENEIISWNTSVQMKFKYHQVNEIERVLEHVFLRNESDKDIYCAVVGSEYYQPMYPQLFPGMWRKVNTSVKPQAWNNSPKKLSELAPVSPEEFNYVMIVKEANSITAVDYFSNVNKTSGMYLSSKYTDTMDVGRYYPLQDLHKNSWASHHYEFLISSKNKQRVYFWTRRASERVGKVIDLVRESPRELATMSTIITLDFKGEAIFNFFDVVAEGKLGCRLLSLQLDDMTFKMNSARHYYEMKGHRRVDFNVCVGSVYPCETAHYSINSIPFIQFNGTGMMQIMTRYDPAKPVLTRHHWCKLEMHKKNQDKTIVYYRKGENESNPKLPLYIPIYTESYRSYVIYNSGSGDTTMKLIEQDSGNAGLNMDTASPFIVYSQLDNNTAVEFPYSVYKKIGSTYDWKITYDAGNQDSNLKLAKKDLLPLLYSNATIIKPKSANIRTSNNVLKITENKPDAAQVERYIREWFFPDDASALSFLRACGYLMTRKSMKYEFNQRVGIASRVEAHIHRNPVLDKFMYMDLEPITNFAQIYDFFYALNLWLMHYFQFWVVLYKVPSDLSSEEEYISSWQDLERRTKVDKVAEMGLHQYYIIVMNADAKELTDGQFAYSLWFKENKNVDGRKSYFGDLIDFLPYDNAAIADYLIKAMKPGVKFDFNQVSQQVDFQGVMMQALSSNVNVNSAKFQVNTSQMRSEIEGRHALLKDVIKSSIQQINTIKGQNERQIKVIMHIATTYPEYVIDHLYKAIQSGKENQVDITMMVRKLKAARILCGKETMDSAYIDEVVYILLCLPNVRHTCFSTVAVSGGLTNFIHKSPLASLLYAALYDDYHKMTEIYKSDMEQVRESYVTCLYMLSASGAKELFAKYKYSRGDKVRASIAPEPSPVLRYDTITREDIVQYVTGSRESDMVEMLNNLSLEDNSYPYVFMYISGGKNQSDLSTFVNKYTPHELAVQYVQFIKKYTS